MGDKRLYLIDATAFCYRAFYALKGLSTSFGQPTNAVYGFINILQKILKEKKPDFLGACFDVSRETFRQKKFAEYKIQRPPMPDGLSSQIPLIKEVISAYGIAIFEKEGFEADDIIATMAEKAKVQGFSVTVVSSDKDMLQLVDEKTTVFSPYKDEGTLYDSQKVYQRFGVNPQQIPDLIALMGDEADNIPGACGIGEKNAVALISSFGTLEKLLANIENIKQEKMQRIIRDNLDKINLSRDLAVLDKDVDIDFAADRLKIGEQNLQELFRLFKYLEFKKFLKDLPCTEAVKEADKVETFKDSKLKDFLNPQDELFLCGGALDNLIFSAKNKFFKVDDSDANIKAILQDPQIKKIGHDLKKLKVSLARDNIILKGLYFDTMVASYLLDPSKPQYLLVDLAWDFLGQRLPEGAMDNQRAIGLILELKPRLEKELREKQLSTLFRDLEMPLIEVLGTMELNGIKLNIKVLEELARQIEKRLIELIAEIYDQSGTQFNINSPKQLGQVLFEKLKLPVIKRGKSGPSTNEEVLKKLAAQHKLPALLLEYRQLTKLKNTYIDTLPTLVDKKTQRVHASFNQTATETGRLSSSNPNLQNIPVKTEIGARIRQAIIASGQDNYLLSCDYSQIELRILAHLSGDKNLLLAFGKDMDMHRAAASLIYGVAEPEVNDVMRDNAKRVNFGIIYGLTSYGLARDLGISVDDAQGFIDAYFAKYPGVKDYIQEQITKAEEQGFVTTLLGRRRYIPEINNKNQGIRQFAQRQAVNTPIQGSASDLIKLAMVEIDKEMSCRKLKSRMIIQIHDELVFDVPSSELKELTGLVKERMENVLKLDVPVKVQIKKGKNWLEMEAIK